MPDAIKHMVKPEDGSKPIWRRSSVGMAAVLLALKEVAPDTPWYGYAIVAVVVVIAQQWAAPSVSRSDLP